MALRWAVDLSGCACSAAQFVGAMQSIQSDEAKRVMEFNYRDDALSCLTGRLLLRRAARLFTGQPNAALRFERCPKGKPFLPAYPGCALNVSHDGHLVALAGAADTEQRVGVDVVDTWRSYGSDGVGKFLRLMRTCFTPREWGVIGEDLMLFHRHWALKESALKALGVGIGHDLQDLCFSVPDLPLPAAGSARSVLTPATPLSPFANFAWTFHELFLLDRYYVCVALATPRVRAEASCAHGQCLPMRFLSFDELLDGADRLHSVDPCWPQLFELKPLKSRAVANRSTDVA